MKIIIEVDNEVYRKAICEGWNREYQEELKPEDFKCLDNVSDLIRAISELSEEDIKVKFTGVK
jgi:hypothetical protein